MILNIVLVIMTLMSMYFLPAFFHISIHIFKHPLAIIVPPCTPLIQTPSHSQTSLPPMLNASPCVVHDDLLLCKERALQKCQFRKQIVWEWACGFFSGLVLLGSLGLSVIYWGFGRIRNSGDICLLCLDMHYHGAIGGHL